MLQLAIMLPCPHVVAHRRFVGRGVLFGTIVVALLVRFHVTAIRIFIGLAEAWLLNTYPALVLPFVATAFGLFLLRPVFAQILAKLERFSFSLNRVWIPIGA